MAERATVFFYGLFMDPEALQEQGPRPSSPRRAYVDRVALRLGKRATLVPDSEGRVNGVLMTLVHSEIDRLYPLRQYRKYRGRRCGVGRSSGTILAFNPTDEERNV
jgi:Gamma-glutamyl cyclotransferase, AIG2-like